jgi:2-octaprenylphenol hydroxylase
VSPSPDYDVIIAGGGMVGAALACALNGGHLRVALIEGAPLARIRPEVDVDLRVSAITCASQRLFSALGAWEPMIGWRVSPFRDMRVWDAAGPGQIHFDSATIGEPLLGWIIENRVIQYALLERAQALDNVDLLCPAAVSSVTLRDDAAQVQLDDDRALRARLLVGADGATSRVRRWADIHTEGWSYDQKAVVATISTERFHAETAWQRFLPTGPLAFLPLHDGRCSIVWSTTPAQADHLLQLDKSRFALELAEAFEWRLGGVTGVTARGAFPLRLQHARSYIKPRVALIGDAAHVVHPLAGQGVNLGLMDAAALAEVLLDALAAGKDIGSPKVLRRYERWRRSENLLMMGVLDGFKRLFGSTLTPVRLLRNLGLNLTDAAVPVKNLLARRAMGLSGDLPRLVQASRG